MILIFLKEQEALVVVNGAFVWPINCSEIVIFGKTTVACWLGGLTKLQVVL